MVQTLIVVVLLAACTARPRAHQAPEPAEPAIEPTPAEPAAPVVFAPDQLPEWPLVAEAEPADRAEPVSVHAVDADGMVIQGLLFIRGRESLVRPWHRVPITGRVAAPSSDAARRALEQAYPELRPTERLGDLPGKGRRIDLQMPRAGVRPLFRLLGDVLEVNFVLGPGDPGKVGIFLRNQPGDGTAEALARTVGRTVRRHGRTWFVLAEGETLDDGLLAVRGPRLDVTTSTVGLAELLATVAQLARLDLRAPCDGRSAPPISLRDASLGEALAALSLVSQTTLEPGDPKTADCAPSRWDGGDLLRLSEVLAVVSVGARRVALVRDGEGALFFLTESTRPEARVVIRPDRIVLVQDEVSRVLEVARDEPDEDPLVTALRARDRDGLRLAATVVGQHPRWALLENAAGNTFWGMSGTGPVEDVQERSARFSLDGATLEFTLRP